MASFLNVSGDTLTYEGREFVVKGFNLEIYAGSDNSIWPGYHGDKARIERLVDKARNPMGANTIRVVFPKDSVATDGNGEVLPEELDKLEHFLRLLGNRGMGAIVTMFNREDYTDIGRRERDKAKVWSFLRRFGQDPRIFLWDLVNEPPLGGPDQIAVLEWVNDLTNRFRAFRDDQGRPPAQPFTIGVDWHHALEVRQLEPVELRSVLALSDVISIHCYGRFAEGHTPTDDDYGVKYKDEKFLGGVLHWIRGAAQRQDRDKPILLEEFGWPDHHTLCWPPGEDPDCKEMADDPPHPWRVYSFPRTADSMDQLYAEMLGVIDRDNPNPPNPQFGKVAGAIQWTLQDSPENPHHHFGIMTTTEEFKRAPIFEGLALRATETTTPSATEAFANWGAGHVWHIPIPPPDDAEFIGQTVPTFMEAGRKYAVSVTMKNTGTTTWIADRQRYALGSQLPDNNSQWGLNRVYVTSNVAVGQEWVFNFEVTAPLELDKPVPFRWKMIRANVGAGWFGERNDHVDVIVAKDAQFVSQQVEASMVAGTTMNVSVTMRNISGVVWPKGGQYRLGSQDPQDNTTWGRLRVDMPDNVPTGTNVKISFSVRAPATVDQHNFQWRMVQEGVAWIGQRTPTTVIRVMPAVLRGAVFVSQKVPKVMMPGSTHRVSVTMRNVGTTTWTAATKFRLAPQYPLNNTRWGVGRVELPHAVAPNEYVTFAFDVRAHGSAGTMDFGWQMVQDVEDAGPFGQVTPKFVVIVGTIRWQAGFQANTGTLWSVGYDNRGELGLGMAPGTSPSITVMPTGGWSAAFQATGGDLWVVGALNIGSMNLGMQPKTSPSIGSSPVGGWQVAFQANTGVLWVVGTESPGAMRVAMAPETSPSLAMLTTGGWVTATQASDSSLTISGNDPTGSMGLGMMARTSPSVAGLRGTSGGWQAAFQANTGMLWVVGQDSIGSMDLGMAPNTSPSIAALSTGGWVVAFQANTGVLWVVGTDNRGSLELGMMPGTSPSIAATPGAGWQVAFQANDGGLWIVGADSRGALRLGMAPGTNPSVACDMRIYG